MIKIIITDTNIKRGEFSTVLVDELFNKAAVTSHYRNEVVTVQYETSHKKSK